MDQIAKAQLRKGLLEYCILLAVGNGKAYSSDIIETLKESDLIIVEGTMYPLLTRMKNNSLLEYSWKESESGPPRKYYSLTPQGKALRLRLDKTWDDLITSVSLLRR
jgi:PadR family transcriptional regulator PadR